MLARASHRAHLGISNGVVHSNLRRAGAAGLNRPLQAGMSDEELEPRRDRGLGEAMQYRTGPRQMDVHNRRLAPKWRASIQSLSQIRSISRSQNLCVEVLGCSASKRLVISSD